MSVIRKDVVHATLARAYASMDRTVHNNIHKQYKFRQQIVLADKSLTKNEKAEAIRVLDKTYDKNKVLFDSGTKRICKNCNQECLATLYCEYCVRDYLKANFPNWTSGNDDIDKLIQECQMRAISPSMIVEWIPYNDLQDIKFLTKGGCSEIYTAKLIYGMYEEWDSKKKRLKRFGRQKIILKRLENVERADQRWFDEAKSHFTISNKWVDIVKSYGLTQDPSNGSYMLVIDIMATNLRTYLLQNYGQLFWKEKIQIATKIAEALYEIHLENAIHRDLHSGNILFSQIDQIFRIGDLGFCGPADKSLKSIYGNLPYIAPEVIAGKNTTKASDIYSIAILMWEISSGQPPFINHKHDYHLAVNIVNGIRPKIISGTPSEYTNLMEQCWDADPSKRPDVCTLWNELLRIGSRYQNDPTQSSNVPNTNKSTNYMNYTSRLFTSKVYQFENFPEPRNATKEQQEAFHSVNSYDSCLLGSSIDDFDKNGSASKTAKGLSQVLKFNEPQINSENTSQKINANSDGDKDDAHNNPNFYSK